MVAIPFFGRQDQELALFESCQYTGEALSLKDIESLKDCKSAAIAPGFSNPVTPG